MTATVKAWFKQGIKILEFDSKDWAFSEMKRIKNNNPDLKHWEFMRLKND